MTDEPTRILSVCSHNRTRSVMIAAMLQALLDERLEPGSAIVSSAGFGPVGLPAIPDAVAAMAARGHDVSAHRSGPITESLLDESDLVLTAERDHVVRIATMSPAAFAKAMTLPEFLTRSNTATAADDLASWIAELTEQRTTADYLSGSIGEIADPTGAAPKVFAAAVEQMYEQCVRAADRIAAHVR